MALKCHSPQNCPYSVAIIDGSYMYYFYSDGNASNLEAFALLYFSVLIQPVHNCSVFPAFLLGLCKPYIFNRKERKNILCVRFKPTP